MKNKLAVLDRKLPLRAYPEEMLNKAIIMDLLPYLTKLLSLTDETSADRLEIALPAIKTSCIGMGFEEIKKMFEMYVDSKLSIKPIPNYFDRILLGKIISEYKQQKPKPKKVIENKISDEEKKKINDSSIAKSLAYFEEHRVVDTSRIYVYDILDMLGYLPTDLAYKNKIKEDAIYILNKEYAEKKPTSVEDKRNIDRIVENLHKKSNSIVIVKCKELALAKFYRKLTHDIKELEQFKNKFSYE